MMYDLILGDCIEEMAALSAKSVDLVLTDPPYGTTQCKWDAVIPFAPMWEQIRRILKPEAAVVFTASQPFTSALIMSNVKDFRYQWVWEKTKATGHLNAKKRPLVAHEDVLVFSSGPPPYYPQGTKQGVFSSARPAKGKSRGEVYGEQSSDYAASTVGNYPRSVLRVAGEHKPIHPTQKPVALMEYLIRTYTNEGDTVLDFTMGSGTTGVACVNTGRNFIGIERDDTYFAMAESRIVGAV